MLITPHAPAGKAGRPPFATEVMLRIHLLQQVFGHSDSAMEEALHDIPLYREFARLDAGIARLPDKSTILRFRHLLEAHDLGAQILATINTGLEQQGLLFKTGTVVDATLIAPPSSTKNSTGTRGPEMHQTKKGSQWHFGMKAHIGVEVDSGFVRTVWAHRPTRTMSRRPGPCSMVSAMSWQGHAAGEINEALEHTKARIRAKGEHVVVVIKC